jgi:hypothetical protein
MWIYVPPSLLAAGITVLMVVGFLTVVKVIVMALSGKPNANRRSL